jgi:hypothetical protein
MQNALTYYRLHPLPPSDTWLSLSSIYAAVSSFYPSDYRLDWRKYTVIQATFFFRGRTIAKCPFNHRAAETSYESEKAIRVFALTMSQFQD